MPEHRVVLEQPCEHGLAVFHRYGYNLTECPGGSRRVLEPGELATALSETSSLSDHKERALAILDALASLSDPEGDT